MTDSSQRTGQRLLVAAPLALVVALLAGCSGETQVDAPKSSAGAQPGQPTGQSTTLDAAAQRARERALTATKALRSYAFDSVAALGADVSRVTGRTVLPDAVSYQVTKGTHRQQVVRVRNATYVRVVPGAWKKLAKPSPAQPPLAGLVAALTQASGLKLDAAGTTLSGTISASAASKAGLLTAGSSDVALPLTFTLDAQGHVTRFTLVARLAIAGRTVTLNETTNYTTFDQATPINPP
ncbi:MAG: hypothetical protein ACYCV4_05310 [Dermatophilaceae bacterium]